MNDRVQQAAAIRAENLTKSFGKKQALSDLNFAIGSSGITGLVGRNGAGKTTLLKLCAGLTAKSSGTLEVWGENPLNNLSVLTRLIYSYHDVSYSSGLKLQTILKDYQAMFPNFDLVFARGLLKYFDLNPKKRYTKLSQGTKAIFNFVCALASRTPLTMLDEPVLGMDVTVRKAAYEILIREYSEHPRAFIISSHLMSEIEGFLDDVLVIDEGKLVLHDSIENMRQSAYQLEGDAAALDAFIASKNVIRKDFAETKSSAVIYETASAAAAQEAQTANLHLSAVRPEDLYVYLTRENKGGELEWLWQESKNAS